MRKPLMVLLAGVACSLAWTPALAQDDDPWARSDTSDEQDTSDDQDTSDESDDSTQEDDPFAAPPADDPFAPPGADDPFAPPGADDANGADDADTTDGDGTEGDAPEDPSDADATGETEPTSDDAAADDAQPTRAARSPGDLTRGNVPTGLRIQPYGAGTGADVSQAFVLFANGGTNQTTLRARYATGRVGVSVGLPFVAHRLPRGLPRDTGLGNLQLDLWYALKQTDTGWTGLGVEAHGNIAPGARSYTWVHDADDTWPGYGLDLALQSRRTNGRITRMGRAAIGVRGGRDYAPWAGSYLTVELAAGADVALGERFGIVGEAAFAYWDLSPFDLTGLLRADLSDGLRVRGGMVVPLGVWVGATGVHEDFRGVREMTALVDLSLAL